MDRECLREIYINSIRLNKIIEDLEIRGRKATFEETILFMSHKWEKEIVYSSSHNTIE